MWIHSYKLQIFCFFYIIVLIFCHNHDMWTPSHKLLFFLTCHRSSLAVYYKLTWLEHDWYVMKSMRVVLSTPSDFLQWMVLIVRCSASVYRLTFRKPHEQHWQFAWHKLRSMQTTANKGRSILLRGYLVSAIKCSQLCRLPLNLFMVYDVLKSVSLCVVMQK